MANPSSSSSSSKSPPPPQQLSHFTPIQEQEREEEEEEKQSTLTLTPQKQHHIPTPLHHAEKTHKRAGGGAWVSCNKCRPSSRDKNISLVTPLDSNSNNNSNNKSSSSSFLSAGSSPTGIFKSLVSSLTRRSPKPEKEKEKQKEEILRHRHWKSAATELSHKLVEASKRRDEALLEASRLEKKLLKITLEQQQQQRHHHHCHVINTEEFLSAVSESRAAGKDLARTMSGQLRRVGARVSTRLSSLLRPYSDDRGERGISERLFSSSLLEALLAGALFEDFESPEFRRGGFRRVLDPAARREALRADFEALRVLTWQEVLSRGTRHFSEEFSGFCDRKMSEIVGMLSWNRAWPEPLLQTFFTAAKATWLLHLLANSAKPTIDLFRVEPESEFDPGYMDDVTDKSGRSENNFPAVRVRVMVAPGFYVGNSVVKCKVLCRYDDVTDNNA